MTEVPAGEFIMGSRDDDPDAPAHEKPAEPRYLSKYWISVIPITNGQYEIFVKEKQKEPPAGWRARPPVGENKDHPVHFVSWYDACEYCEWLSAVTGDLYTLPTEAQWEKAARGGIWLDGDDNAALRNPQPERRYPNGNRVISLQDANHDGLEGGTSIAGSRPSGASPYGCLDMSGNVSEWCLDTYSPDAYSSLPYKDPSMTGPGKKVLRGGSWRSEPSHVRCSNRYFYLPERCSYGIGFRVALAGFSKELHKNICR
jgi:iron(II)-dependent oxidoreductase